MQTERYAYDEESDVLEIYFDERRPAWTIELTPNIMVSIDRTAQRPVQLTLLDYVELVRLTVDGPQSFPITGLASLPVEERRLVMQVLMAAPLNRWLDVSTVQSLPDSPFTVTHLEPPPRALVPVFA
jgi:hypothetical protein